MTLTRSLRRASAVAVIATVALLTHVSPASAAGSGATTNGYSNVHQVGNPQVPLCLPANSTSITLYNLGTFNSNPTPVNTTATFTSSANYFFSPAGTFSDSSCTMASAVLGTVAVSGGATCTSVPATYRRVGTNYVIGTSTATTCTRAGSPNETSNLRFTGTQIPCLGPADACGPDGPSAKEFSGVYAQG